MANLTNNKDVFMCILRYHARAGYLQTYQTLLKEINMHPGSAALPDMPDDQYHVECSALSDRNFNLACETGILYPSLIAMLNRRCMMWRVSVILHDMHVYTCTNLVHVCTYLFYACLYANRFFRNRLMREIVRVGYQSS